MTGRRAWSAPRNMPTAKFGCHLLLLTFPLVGCSLLITGREYTLGGRVGEDTMLPCDVNVTLCGRIYFITWTRNMSNEWRRVYMYSDAYEKSMGEGMDPNKVSFKLDTNAAYLRIKSLTIEDEGTYKCDVTYVHGKCPSLSFVHLHAFVVPSEPIVEVESEEALNGSEVGPFTEGSPLVLNCKSFGGRPPPKVTWWNGTHSLSTKTKMKADNNGGFDVISTMRFLLSRWDLGARYLCQVVTNATKTPQEKWIKLDVHVKPLSLRVRGPRTAVVAGEMVSLTCTVNGARPSANITWYNRSDVVRPQPSSSRDLMSDGTFRTSSTLVFVASMYDHQGEFFCKGTNDVLRKRQEAPLLKAARLQVLYPPAVSISPGGTLSIPESGFTNISCTFDANPPNVTEILWYKDGAIYNSAPPESGSARPRRPSPVLILTNISRESAGLYSCEVRNAFGRANSSNIFRLDILYVSEVRLFLDRASVVEGSNNNVTLTCEVASGNPSILSRVRWYQNDSLLRETDDDRLILTSPNRNMTSAYSCEGFNEAGWGHRSESKQLVVQYVPGGASIQQVEEEAIKGKRLTIRCLVRDLGFPPARHYRWFHKGIQVNTTTGDSLLIQPITVTSQGTYTCAPYNEVGSATPATYHFTAKAGPSLVEQLPERGGALRNSSMVNITCRVECDPTCDIDWFRNNESLKDSNQFSSLEEAFSEDTERNIFKSIASTLTWSLSQTTVDAYNDNVFSCRSTGNGVGPGVSSNMVFAVEYPPEDVQLSSVKLELLEGEFVKDLKCSASANPGGEFHWLVGQRLISRGPVLSFNTSLSRDMGGIYTCVVTNRHGRAEADVYVNVLHRPECYLWRDYDHKGSVVLTCSAKGIPPISKFTWFRNNTTLQEVTTTDERISSTYALAADTPDMYGVYGCIATNAIGSSDLCEHELAPLPSPAGWVQLFLQEENLIIVACVAGAIAVLGIVLVTVIVVLVIRRRFSGDPKVDSDDTERSPKYGSRRQLERNLFSPESETEREPFARRICDFHGDLGHHNHMEEPEIVKNKMYLENGVG